MASVLEIALAEWRLAPDYILDHWTEDQLSLYVHKHNERIALQENPQKEKPIPDFAELSRAQEERYKLYKQFQAFRENANRKN